MNMSHMPPSKNEPYTCTITTRSQSSMRNVIAIGTPVTTSITASREKNRCHVVSQANFKLLEMIGISAGSLAVVISSDSTGSASLACFFLRVATRENAYHQHNQSAFDCRNPPAKRHSLGHE